MGVNFEFVDQKGIENREWEREFQWNYLSHKYIIRKIINNNIENNEGYNPISINFGTWEFRKLKYEIDLFWTLQMWKGERDIT